MSGRVVVMKPGADNVATALEDLPAGALVEAAGQAVTLLEPIPFGHKLALRDIAQGEPVCKYGQVIGTASRPIRAGEHVHVHNVLSNRGRGDLATARG